MTDVALVAIELKQEGEMLQFHIGVLSKHAVAIQLLVHDVREEALRDQCDLQITLVAGVVIHDIIGDIVRIKRLDLAIGIHRKTDCTGDADRLCIGDTAIFVKGRLSIMAVFQTKFDLITFLRHRLFLLSPCGRLIRSAHTGLHTFFRFRSRPRFSRSRVHVQSGLLQYLLPYPGLCNRCTPQCPAG